MEQIEKRVALALAIVGAAVFVLVWVAFHTGHASLEASEWVSHTQTVLAELDDIQAEITQVRMNMDRFITTGNESDLAAYRAGPEQIRHRLSVVRRLTSDNPRQQSRMIPLEQAIGERLRILETAIAARRQSGSEAALQALRSDAARNSTQAVRKIIVEMTVEENALLTERQSAFASVRQEASIALVSMIAVVLVLLGLVWYILDRDVHRRKWAHEALRSSAEKLHDLYENAPCGYYSLDSHDFFVQINATLLAWLGYAREEVVLKKRFRELLTPESAGRFETALARFKEGGRIDELALDMVRKQGTILPILLAAGALRNARGNYLSSRGTVFDITERKRAEAAREQLAAIVDYTDDAIIRKTLEGVIVSWNKGAEHLYGYPEEEVIGKSISILMPPDHEDELAAILQTLRQGISIRHKETVRRTKDGRPIDVSLTISPIKDAEGRVTGAAVVARDITERKRIERELREHSATLQVQASLLEIASDSIMVLDARGAISFWNQGAVSTYGWSKAEAVGQVPGELLQTQFRRPPQEIEAALARDGRWEGELNHARKDGSRMTVASRWVAQRDEQGQRWRTLIINNDITERLRVEQEIRQLNETLENRNTELVTVNKEMESFSYSVSHDLRAPLRAIDGFSLALLEDCADKLEPEEKKHLDRVRAAAAKMGQLIDDMLTLSRTTRHDLVPEEVNLSNLAMEVMSQLRNSQAERCATIVIAPNLVTVGDRGLLRIVLDNLLGNSWKFTSKKPQTRIEFGMRCEGEQKIYFINDNGAGFDMKYANKLFGAFQRLHDNREFPGTGIGLANVQRIIHRHRGRVWAESAVGQGATFYFALWENKSDSAG